MSVNRLRIAMLSVHSCPVGNLGARDTGGMSVYIREVARELGRQGHHVDVYTRVHDPADPRIVDLGRNARLIHLEAGPEETMHKLVLYSHLPDFTCNLESYRRNSGLRYDFVFSHYWLSGWVGRYLERWWQVPHITMFHTLGAVKNSLGIDEDEPELRIVNETVLAQNCHRIIAATEREKDDLARRYGASPDSISVIPCGVDLELFQPIEREIARHKLGVEDAKMILFVGRIEPLKGVERLISAIPSLWDTERVKLMIVGGDEYSRQEINRLRRMSFDLGIEDSVTFSGMVDQKQLPCYYSAADVCVVPSYYESFGLVALESLACGTPVVATDVGHLKNLVKHGETGYIVASNTPQHLADGLSMFLSRPARDMETALSVRASVANYKWADIAEKIAGQFQRMLEGRLAQVS